MPRNFVDILKSLINNTVKMGGVCSIYEKDKEVVECRHRKKPKKGDRPSSISQDISQNQICEICLKIRQIKELRDKSKEPGVAQTREHLSLATQNQDDDTDSTPSKKPHKSSKKTVHDFQVVRGLGKGAFGRVYLIKEREGQLPLTVEQDILSLKVDKCDGDDSELPEDVEFELRFESQLPEEVANKRILRIGSKVELGQQEPRSPTKSSQLRKDSGRTSGSPRFYALKIILKNAITSKKEKKQAMSQRYILEAMDHPFIVKLHFAFQTRSRLFLIVDLLAGGELFYLLRKMRKFKETIARFYAAEILLAIEYLHERSIIYRDIKPENILLDAEGHVKITDFGLSKVMYSSNQKTYSLCGTPEYMAPEVIIGKGYTQAADWFSFGSLIYDMLTGRPPFLNNNKSVMLNNLVSKPVPLPYYLSENAKSLLTGLFKIDPEHRLGFREGAAEIKKHKFFKDIDFEELVQRRIEPPISFQDEMKETVARQGEAFLNSGGFEKWNSWHMNMESFSMRRTKDSKQQHFEGFSFEHEDYELEVHQEEESEPAIPRME